MPQLGGVLPNLLVGDDLLPAGSLFIIGLLSPSHDRFLERRLRAVTTDVPKG
jgi:hypothetical protein